MSTKPVTMQLFSCTLLILMILSCGRENNEIKAIQKDQIQPDDLQYDDGQGVYRADLKSLNTNIAGDTTGTVKITIEGDTVLVESHVFDSPSGVKHIQNIMLGNSCPDLRDDLNGDSLIDWQEAMGPLKGILLPMDSDLSEQFSGIDYGPISNDSGAYVYRRSASLGVLISDLRGPDPDPADILKKLNPEENLDLSRRVVVIHGVRESSEYPSTQSVFHDFSPSEGVPIACGAFIKLPKGDSLP